VLQLVLETAESFVRTLLKNISNNFPFTSNSVVEIKLSERQDGARTEIIEIDRDEYFAVAGGPQISNRPG
jgi:hypothetical protein